MIREVRCMLNTPILRVSDVSLAFSVYQASTFAPFRPSHSQLKGLTGALGRIGCTLLEGLRLSCSFDLNGYTIIALDFYAFPLMVNLGELLGDLKTASSRKSRKLEIPAPGR